MTTENPYVPPKTPLSLVPGAEPVFGAARGGFPWLMVLRWILGIGVLVYGLIAALTLVQIWSLMAERSIIAPELSPYRQLPCVLLQIATAVAILLRSRWSIALAVGWTAAWCFWLLGDLPLTLWLPIAWVGLAKQFGVVAFLCLLGLRGRLR